MKITYLTTHHVITSEQMETLLLNYHTGERIPDTFVYPKTNTTKRLSSYNITLNDSNPEHHFYIDLAALGRSFHGLAAERLTKSLFNAYIELAPRNGHFDYAGDLSRFILTHARDVSTGVRFYRNDGSVIYELVAELVTRMEVDNLILLEMELVHNTANQITGDALPNGQGPIVRVIADSR